MLITESAKLALTELREKAYLPKFGQRLRNDAFLWNRHDDESFHFGAYLEHELISTIRLTRVESQELFETLLQLSGAHPFASLPCWVLSRAATAPNYLGRSINMQLRAEAYRFLLSRRRPDAADGARPGQHGCARESQTEPRRTQRSAIARLTASRLTAKRGRPTLRTSGCPGAAAGRPAHACGRTRHSAPASGSPCRD